ncbi:MAG TPA: sugar phosphate nucleotidyltransferase [Candidatus Krumholzibacteria bacterium]|nr:sugar phosphate nucleotidyltransferase [Candidatus Krumholzibacteria bacterium]
MKALIPAAGAGKRLRPHTITVPKALLLVAGRPILGHILEDLSSAGIDEFVIVVGYRGDSIRKYIAEEHPDLRVSYVEQKQRLGLGHAVGMCKDVVKSGPLLTILGDTVVRADLPSIIRSPQNIIATCAVEDPRRFGIVELDKTRVTRFVEKPENPTSNQAIVGLYTFQKSELLFDALDEIVREGIRTKNEFQLTDALQLLLQRGEEFYSQEIDGWYDCGKPETLLETNRVLLGDEGPIYAEGSVVIKEPVVVHPTARLTGSVIGPHVTVGRDAVIKGSIVANSIINDGASIDGANLEGSLIGAKAKVIGRGSGLNVGDFSQVELR